METKESQPTTKNRSLDLLSSGQAGGSGQIRVLLADDHPVVRRGLAACLAAHRQIEVVAEAADGREAIQKAKESSPDIILMDIEMSQVNGLSATEILKREQPDAKVIILTAHRHPEYVARVLQSGARGCVLKEAPTEELVRAIENVHAGHTAFSEDTTSIALNRFVRGGQGPQLNQLSNRNQEVLIGIAEGLSSRDIAARLGIGVRTVETHREHIMQELNIHSIAGLTRFAIAKGLVAVPKLEEAPVAG